MYFQFAFAFSLNTAILLSIIYTYKHFFISFFISNDWGFCMFVLYTSKYIDIFMNVLIENDNKMNCNNAKCQNDKILKCKKYIFCHWTYRIKLKYFNVCFFIDKENNYIVEIEVTRNKSPVTTHMIEPKNNFSYLWKLSIKQIIHLK